MEKKKVIRKKENKKNLLKYLKNSKNYNSCYKNTSLVFIFKEIKK